MPYDKRTAVQIDILHEHQIMGIIRCPNRNDISTIIDGARRFHAESYFSYFPLDEGKIISIINDSERNNSYNFVRIYDSGHSIDGIVMGYVAPYWFSNAVGAFDYCLYVVPERRGSLISRRLWDAFIKWARERGAIDLTCGVSTDINPQVAQRFFTGLGMTTVGSLYKIRL